MINEDATAGDWDADGLVLPVGDGHAVVITRDPTVDVTGVGSVEAPVSLDALTTLASSSKVIADGFRMNGRLTGRLVELDARSQAAFASARKIVEPGGFVQGTLRAENGKITHVVRIRPARAADLAAGAANLIAAVAAQAQLAAIHRDVLKTLEGVKQVSHFQRVALLSRVQADSEEIGKWTDLLLDGGSTSRVLDAVSGTARRLRASRVEVVNHMAAIVRDLSDAVETHSLLRARKALEGSQIERLGAHLEFSAAAHAAAVQGEALICADLLFRNDVAAAAAHISSMRKTAKSHAARIRGLAEQAITARGEIESEYRPLRGYYQRRSTIRVPLIDRSVRVPTIGLPDSGARLSFVVRDRRAERDLRGKLDPLGRSHWSTGQLVRRSEDVIAVTLDQQKAVISARTNRDVVTLSPRGDSKTSDAGGSTGKVGGHGSE